MLRLPHWLLCLISLLPLYLAAAGPSIAQSEQRLSLTDQAAIERQQQAWSRASSNAAQLLDSGSPSERSLQQAREALVAQRDLAYQIIQRGSVTVRSLKAQLDALGPAPADGSAEAPSIAEQRASLVDALASANAPVLAAQQAYEQSGVLIQEIDRTVREADYERLIARSPAAINPLIWPSALSELTGGLANALQTLLAPGAPEGSEGWGDLVISLLLIGIGLVIAIFVHPFAARRLSSLMDESEGPRRTTLLVLTSHLERILVPFLGLAATVVGIATLQPGDDASAELGLLLLAPLVIVAANGLGNMVFSPRYPPAQIVRLPDANARQATRLSQALGWVLVAGAVYDIAVADQALSPDSLSVLAFLVALAGAFCLWGMGQLARRKPGAEEATEEASLGSALLGPFGIILQVVALAAVVAAAIGYIGLSRQIILAAIFTLAVIAAMLVLHRAILALPTLIAGQAPTDLSGRGSLISVALGALLAVTAVPIIALLWGARITDITELWMMAIQGVELGGFRFSLTSALLLIGIFMIGLFATHWAQVVVRTTVLPRTKADSGVATAIVTFLGYLGVLLAAFVAAGVAGIDLSNLAIVAGALSVGIGFGLQAIVSNFLSGIILLVERPIKQGDWIEVAGYSGTVKKIAVRSTRIETFDRHDVIVPNADIIAGTVKNMTLGSRLGRVVVPVGVAYGSDVEKVRDLLLDIAARHPMTMQRPAPAVLFQSLGDNALQLELRCIIRDVMETASVKSDLLFTIYREFEEAGYSIPFPQRDVRVSFAGDAALALEDRLRPR